jgi:hypothetical protein
MEEEEEELSEPRIDLTEGVGETERLRKETSWVAGWTPRKNSTTTSTSRRTKVTKPSEED